MGSFNFKAIQYVKIGINEVVYRSSFVVSIPENYFKNLKLRIDEHLSFHEKFKKNETTEKYSYLRK